MKKGRASLRANLRAKVYDLSKARRLKRSVGAFDTFTRELFETPTEPRD